LYKVQWQAWLRHTRYEPPSLQELFIDEKRKAIVQDRARVLDKQWEQVGDFCILQQVIMLIIIIIIIIIIAQTGVGSTKGKGRDGNVAFITRR
jgi:hypothetical protein